MKKKILKKRHEFFCAPILIFIMALSACGTQSEFIYESENNENNISAPGLSGSSEDLDSYMEENEIKGPEFIYVYVGGHVQNKGIYVLDKGSRVCDAINAAGGTDRDLDSLNLNPAAVLSDGERLIVREKEDNNMVNKDNNMVNINTAGVEALKNIPGIGEVRAKAIIDYRETKGQFKTVKDITKVSGIKEGTFEKIKDYITVD